ncbi:MAG: hypothetical protein GY765_19990 [bacterium]|nr:hypothetical protein [bacterium]
MKRKTYIIINLMVAVVIVFFLYQKFYSRQIIIDGAYNSIPGKLIEIKNKYLPASRKKNLNLLFVFNKIPRGTTIETVEKLNAKFGSQISTTALFFKRFKPERRFDFPHRFVNNLEIIYKQNTSDLRGNYFLILKKDKIIYADDQFEISHLALLLEKNINPALSYKDLAMSAGRLEQRIIARIKAGSFSLLRLQSGELKRIEDIVHGEGNTYFIHAACSTCKLKAMLSDIKIKQMLDGRRNAIIFSCIADTFSLDKFSPGKNMEIYIDTHDEFDLMAVITNQGSRPLVIEGKSLLNVE